MIAAGPFSELAVSLAALLFMVGGFCLMFQQKQWAGRLLLGGVALAAGATILPNVSRVSEGVTVPWQWALALAAIIFGALRQWGIAALLAAPLLYSLVVWPVVSTLPVMLAVVVVVFLVLGGITRILNVLFGHEATGHVVGTYLVRLIDAVFALPFLLARGRMPRNPSSH